MTEERVLQIVASEISRLTEKPAAEIEAAASESIVTLGIDSLDLMELTGSIERRLGIENIEIEAWLESTTERPDAYSLQSLVEWCRAASAGAGAASGCLERD